MCSHHSSSKELFIVNVNGVLCYFLQIVILQRKHVRGKNIDNTKMEVKAKIQQFFTHAFKKFILEFGLVCWLRMLWKFLFCYCCKPLLTKFFSFGGVNNVQWHHVNSQLEIIIVSRILVVCILLIENYRIGKKTKPCSLMMSRAKLFKIPRVMVFFRVF